MGNINLIDSFREFKDFKNIDRPTVISVLEEVFRSMLRKRYGTDENCDIIVNPDNGDLEIWRTRVVVEDEFSEDDDLEIELAEAKKIVQYISSMSENDIGIVILGRNGKRENSIAISLTSFIVHSSQSLKTFGVINAEKLLR